MAQSWKMQTGPRTDSVDVTPDRVFLGVDEGFGHGCSAAAASHAEFLSGRLNEEIRAIFGGSVLAEVRAAVGTLLSNSATQHQRQPGMRACADCMVGYHAPFDRFEQVAVQPDGPLFLMRCTVCRTLWQESLREAHQVNEAEARARFPDFAIPGEDGA